MTQNQPDPPTQPPKQAWFSTDRVQAIAIFLVLLTAYAYTFPRWADWNQNSRLYLVQAIVDYGTLSIDCCRENTGDYAEFEGRAYSDKAPGLSFLSLSTYAAYRAIASLEPVEAILLRAAESPALAATLNPDGSGLKLSKLHLAAGMIVSTVLFVSLPSALLGVVMYYFLGAFSSNRGYRVIVVLVYGLATIAFPYSSAFYAHQLVAVLLFMPFAFASWLTPHNSTPWRLFGLGVMLGYAVIAEYPAILIAAPVFLYLFYRLPRKGRIAWVILGGLLPGIIAMIYNYAIFRTPMPVAYNYSVEWVGVHGITTFQWHAFWGISFSSYRGLFFMSPILILAIWGLVYSWQHRHDWPEVLVTTVAVVGLIVFNSCLKTWAGGFSVGPRYLVPMVPFLAWPLIFFLERHGRSTWGRILCGLLTLVSLFSVWTLSLAGQRFPQDLPLAVWHFPLRDYSLPLLLEGNIARNVGVIFGLRDGWSLLPLLATIIIILFLQWLLTRGRQTTTSQSPQT